MEKNDNQLDDFLDRIKRLQKEPQEIMCLHDSCTQCNGTGKKADGQMCIHFISCPCKKCTPYYL